jgi:hypothetical protein
MSEFYPKFSSYNQWCIAEGNLCLLVTSVRAWSKVTLQFVLQWSFLKFQSPCPINTNVTLIPCAVQQVVFIFHREDGWGLSTRARLRNNMVSRREFSMASWLPKGYGSRYRSFNAVQAKAGHWLMAGSQTGSGRGVKVRRGEAITGMFSGHPRFPLVCS